MLKLNAGFSRKVGEPNYGSRGASVNVELEVEGNLIGDPDALAARIHNLFLLARQSVDHELNGGNAPTNGHTSRGPGNRRLAGNGGSHHHQSNNTDRPVRSATASQVRAIRSICQRRQLDADQVALDRFEVNTVEDLTLQEASALIDELKGAASNGQNGGAR